MLRPPEYMAPGELLLIDGGRVHYLKDSRSDGTPVVLLSGLGMWSAHYRPLLEQLSLFGPVLVPDRPGYGWSDTRPLPRSVDSNVEFLFSFLRAAEVDGKVILVGHSYGGLLAVAAAHRQPNAIAGVVLVDCAHPEMWSRLPETIGATRPLRIAESWRAAGLAAAGILDPDLADHARMLESREHVSALIALQAAQTHAAIAAELETCADRFAGFDSMRDSPLSIPTILLTARQSFRWFIPDESLPVYVQAQEVWFEMQEELAKLFVEADHRLVDGDHMLHLSAPKKILDAVRELQA